MSWSLSWSTNIPVGPSPPSRASRTGISAPALAARLRPTSPALRPAINAEPARRGWLRWRAADSPSASREREPPSGQLPALIGFIQVTSANRPKSASLE